MLAAFAPLLALSVAAGVMDEAATPPAMSLVERLRQEPPQGLITALEAAAADVGRPEAERTLLIAAQAEAQRRAGDDIAAQLTINELHAAFGVEVARLAQARVWLALDDALRVIKLLEPLESRSLDETLLLVSADRALGRKDAAVDALRDAVTRWPGEMDAWAALMRLTIDDGRLDEALDQARLAERRVADASEAHLLAAEALLALDRPLGRVRARRAPGARVGQIVGEWFILEQRGDDGYLCCPRESAIFHVRAALDGGIDRVDAHVLHARILSRASRHDLAMCVLRGREPLLANADPALIGQACEVALAADALPEYARWARLWAERAPERRREILLNAYQALAERYNERGLDEVFVWFLDKSVELDPLNAELALRLGDAQWEAQRPELARPLYQRVLELNPLHPDHRRLLERLASD